VGVTLGLGSIRNAVRPPRRLLAGAAAALALCLVATGCDSSPFAASVNGRLIKEAGVNQQLAQLSANQTFITDSVEASTANGGEGMKVKGDADGTYSSTWTASVLTAMVTAEVVQQHLVQTNDLPSADQVDVARAVDAAAYSTGMAWYHFSAQTRTTLAQRDADLAQVVPLSKSVTQTQLREIYDSALQNTLFTNVCIRDVDVNVTGTNGVDYPASLAKAKSLVSQIDAAGVKGAANAAFGGSVSCYTHAQFEALPSSLIAAALDIKAGKAGSPTKTTDGYSVVAIMSRQLIPFGSAFAKAVSVIVQVNSINSSGSTLPSIEALMAKARIKVDPQYGTWKRTKNGYAVVASSGPATHTAVAAGAV
jgi:hypothetical protein